MARLQRLGPDSPGWPSCSWARTRRARSTSGPRGRRARKPACTRETIRLPADDLRGRAPGDWSTGSTPTPRSTASWSSCRCRSTSTARRCSTRIDPAKDVDGFHPVNVGKLVIGDPTALQAGHAVRRAADADPLRHRDQGRARGHRRPLEHRRQADGEPADPARAGRRRDGHGLPLADRATCPPSPARPTSWSRPSGSRSSSPRDMVRPGAVVIDVGINRVDDAVAARRATASWATWPTSRWPRSRRRHHAGAGWRGPDDDRDAAAEHAAGHEAGADSDSDRGTK